MNSREIALKLFEENEKLVWYVYHKRIKKNDYIRSFVDDLYQEGCRGLWQGCLSYDASQNYMISSFLVKCIERRMIRFIKQFVDKVPNDILSLDLSHSDDNGPESLTLINNLEFYDVYFDDYRITKVMKSIESYINNTACVKKSYVNHYKSQIPKYYRIVTMLDIGFNQSEIAKDLGISRERVRQIIGFIKEAIIHTNVL